MKSDNRLFNNKLLGGSKASAQTKTFLALLIIGIASALLIGIVFAQPTVNTKVPLPGASNVELTTEVSITFEENIFEDINWENIWIFYDDDGVDTDIGATPSINGDTINFTPTPLPLAFSTEYTVEIPTSAIKDGDDISNAEIIWSFTTRDITPAPSGETFQPVDLETDVEIDAEVSIIFDMDITETVVNSVFDNAYIKDEFDAGFPADANLDGNKIIFTPNPPSTTFDYETTYTVVIPEDTVQNIDLVSNEEITWTFTTKALQHDLTIDSTAGGSVTTPAEAVTTHNHEDVVALVAEADTGYYFVEWTGDIDEIDDVESESTTIEMLDNYTITATFAPNEYTVTFNSHGGTAPSPASKQVTYDGTYGDLATTSRTGYTFDGWFTETSGGTEITAETIVSIADDHTLFAQWTANEYTITFEAQGGTAPSPASKQVTYDGTYGDLATTSRTGYTFDGWFTETSGGTEITAETIVSIADDHTLFAQWSEIVTVSNSEELIDALENPLVGTINVEDGIYYGKFDVILPQTIQAVNKHGAILDGQGENETVVIISDDVTLNGFVIRNAITPITVLNAGDLPGNFEDLTDEEQMEAIFATTGLEDVSIINNEIIGLGEQQPAVAIINSDITSFSNNELSSHFSLMFINTEIETFEDNEFIDNFFDYMNITGVFGETVHIQLRLGTQFEWGSVLIEYDYDELSPPLELKELTILEDWTIEAFGASVFIPEGTTIESGEDFSFFDMHISPDVMGEISNLGGIEGALRFGIPDLGLTFSNPINISVPVDGKYEGSELSVYKSGDGENWEYVVGCTVDTGICEFETDTASYFAASLCGANIVTDLTLTNNLVCEGDGLIIETNDITIDCNGYSITGDEDNYMYGIRIQQTNGELSGITVQNCGISNFGTGIYVDGVSNLEITNNEIFGNEGSPTGLSLHGVNGATISNNNIHSNLDGVYINWESDGIQFNNNIISNNFGDGIYSEASNVYIVNGEFENNDNYGMYDDSIETINWLIDGIATCKNNNVRIYGDLNFDGGELTLENCLLNIDEKVVDIEGTITSLEFVEETVEEEKEWAFPDSSSNITVYLDAETPVTMAVAATVPTSAPSGLTSIKGIVVNVNPEVYDSSDGSGSLEWALIKIFYDELPSRISASSLRLYYYNETSESWELEPNQGINETGRYVWANITHFSEFGIFGSEDPTSTTSDSVTKTPREEPETEWDDADETFETRGKVGSEITFNIDGQGHTFKVTGLGTDYADVEIHSEPISFRMYVGETKEVDVNRNGVNDISVYLEKISAGFAYFQFEKLEFVAPIVDDGINGVDEIIDTEIPEEVDEIERETNWTLIIAVIAIIGAIGAIYYYFEIYNKKSE